MILGFGNCGVRGIAACRLGWNPAVACDWQVRGMLGGLAWIHGCAAGWWGLGVGWVRGGACGGGCGCWAAVGACGAGVLGCGGLVALGVCAGVRGVPGLGVQLSRGGLRGCCSAWV